MTYLKKRKNWHSQIMSIHLCTTPKSKDTEFGQFFVKIKSLLLDVVRRQINMIKNASPLSLSNISPHPSPNSLLHRCVSCCASVLSNFFDSESIELRQPLSLSKKFDSGKCCLNPLLEQIF